MKLTKKYKKVSHEEAWLLAIEAGVKVYFRHPDSGELSESKLSRFGASDYHNNYEWWHQMNLDSDYYVRVT